jgi:hypothetical protein
VRVGEAGTFGQLLFSETITEYRDLDGNLVVTARSVVSAPKAQEG